MLKRMLFLGLLCFCAVGFIPIAQAFQEADGFDYPVGNVYMPTADLGDIDGWNNKNPFGKDTEGNSCLHSGDDWNLDTGGATDVDQPVKAIGHGRVVRTTTSLGGVGYDIGGGVMVEHQYKGKTYCSTYEHVEPSIESSQDITRGQTVARIQAITKFSPHGHVSMREGSCPLTGGWYPNSGGSNCLPGYYDSKDKMSLDNLIDPTRFIDEHRVATWHPNGTLVQSNVNQISYLLQNGKKRKIDDDAFAAMGFREEKVIVVSSEEISCYNDGVPIIISTDPASLWPSTWNGYPEGTLAQFTGVTNPEQVYVTSGGFLHWLDMSWNKFISLGYKGDNIYTLDASYAREETFGVDYIFSRFTRCENRNVSFVVASSDGGVGGGSQDMPNDYSSGNPPPAPDQVVAGSGMLFVDRYYDGESLPEVRPLANLKPLIFCGGCAKE